LDNQIIKSSWLKVATMARDRASPRITKTGMELSTSIAKTSLSSSGIAQALAEAPAEEALGPKEVEFRRLIQKGLQTKAQALKPKRHSKRISARISLEAW